MMVISPHRSCRMGRGSSGRHTSPGCGSVSGLPPGLAFAPGPGRSRRTLSRAGMPAPTPEWASASTLPGPDGREDPPGRPRRWAGWANRRGNSGKMGPAADSGD